MTDLKDKDYNDNTENKNKNENERTYQFIVGAGKEIIGIRCLVCEMVSYNPNDIDHLYCGYCHRFHISSGDDREIISE